MKRLLLLLIFGFVSMLSHTPAWAQDSKPLKSKKIAMIIADINFQDDELFIPLEYFKKSGAEVTVTSSKIGEHTGMRGKTIETEKLYLDLDSAQFDAIVFVGGSGAVQYWDDPIAHELAQKTIQNNKILAAICLAPVTLANAGVLKNTNATVWPDSIDQIKQKGAKYAGEGVFADGKIITASGPQYAKKFAEQIVKNLK
ncbi:MAG: DJ-1/PfpI family protein [Candidatus Omnitrophica bacterium]|nr:DJ-1/PfpI family protein [Candidatus Omnitrophota bacterium]